MSGAPGEVVEEFPIEILEIERTFYNVALPKDVSEVSRMIELKPRPLCHWNNFSHNISAWQVSQSLSAEAAVGTLWKHRREATAKRNTPLSRKTQRSDTPKQNEFWVATLEVRSHAEPSADTDAAWWLSNEQSKAMLTQ